MLRSLATALTAATLAAAAFAQPPANPTPKSFPPDAATLKKITDKTAELKAELKNIPKEYRDKLPLGTVSDAEVYHKAAEWIVRHGEWYTEKSAQQTLEVLDAGIARAKSLANGKMPWLEVRGKPVVFGYTAPGDDSVQPFAVRFPDGYDPDDHQKTYRLDIVLHGRDATLTEVKFIHAREKAKPGKPLDHFEVEVYGRGNNAYRWAGEMDVNFAIVQMLLTRVDLSKIVLRGFSMGGAGTWHIGLHDPFRFAVIGPGAGFTTTRGYVGKFPNQPDYIEKCLHIYDAVDYAENVFNVPVVAYSGEKDKQKLAADLIEAKLKDFKEPHSFTHLVAPGLEHKQPPEWMAKLDNEYRKQMKNVGPAKRERVRFVTYTTRYASADDVTVYGMEEHYRKAIVDVRDEPKAFTINTTNVTAILVRGTRLIGRKEIVIDGNRIAVNVTDQPPDEFGFGKRSGNWRLENVDVMKKAVTKCPEHMGPIDDAFRGGFRVVPPSEQPWQQDTAKFVTARLKEFEYIWDKYFRGKLPTTDKPSHGHLVLFGDPASNPLIAQVLPKLPIKWTKDELVVNGVKYDPKTHVPVLIYPNPLDEGKYVVINSGHTFREADLKGTNALLYPRLGDWAVLKPKPTKDDPAGFEVVAAGLFDENWQFEKKK